MGTSQPTVLRWRFCKDNNLVLNTAKTRDSSGLQEGIKTDIRPLFISGDCGGVAHYKFLGITIENNFTWR